MRAPHLPRPWGPGPGDDVQRRERGRARPTREATAEGPLERRVIALQSTAGNAAVQHFLQREVAAPVKGAPKDAPPRPKLRHGDRGDDVRALQEALNQAGAKPALAVDGIYGRRTRAAVRRFQELHPPLARDGAAGPETWAALDGAPAGPKAAPTVDPVTSLYESGRAYYEAERYALAYDEFTKAWEVGQDAALLWNRAQAMRLQGGRRVEAIALYEQFLASNADADEQRRQAREHIDELRGAGRSGNKSLDTAMVNMHFRTGRERYMAEDYGHAYDEFSKAHEITGDPALLWNRAQALRLVGGRRSEAIALYEQVLLADVPDETKAAARVEIAELRGPGATGDKAANAKAVDDLFQKGRERFDAEDYARAYDEFSKSWEISHDPALLWNRAQALRLMGGRRAEAIALYEQVLTADIPDDKKKAAREHITDLRGPAATGGATKRQ